MNVKYFVKNLFRMIILLISVTMLSFFLITSSPLDPIDSYLGEISISEEQRILIEEEWGLNKSPIERYVIWGTNFASGNMGESISYHEPVSKVLKERFQASLLLMGAAWITSGILGFGLGILSGSHEGSPLDKLIKTSALLLASTPVFWVGLIMLVIFAVELQWFPLGLAAPAGKIGSEVTFLERLHHLALPVLTLSITEVSRVTLHTRQKLVEVLNSEYVLFAKARGETLRQIISRHGIRNICLPAITLQFGSISEIFGGSVLAEQVFSYPGLGNAATHAGLHGDAPMLLGVATFSALFVFAGNLMANISYGIIDPRIREGGTHNE